MTMVRGATRFNFPDWDFGNKNYPHKGLTVSSQYRTEIEEYKTERNVLSLVALIHRTTVRGIMYTKIHTEIEKSDML